MRYSYLLPRLQPHPDTCSCGEVGEHKSDDTKATTNDPPRCIVLCTSQSLTAAAASQTFLQTIPAKFSLAALGTGSGGGFSPGCDPGCGRPGVVCLRTPRCCCCLAEDGGWGGCCCCWREWGSWSMQLNIFIQQLWETWPRDGIFKRNCRY